MGAATGADGFGEAVAVGDAFCDIVRARPLAIALIARRAAVLAGTVTVGRRGSMCDVRE